ncbi:MAG TPA: ammonium transporter [Bryobacteraceae bacterium]|jgi:Amt family ammonium transporter
MMPSLKTLTRLSVLPFLFSVAAFAQNAPVLTVEQRLANAEQAVKAAQSAGDNAWMLVSAALVLMMTGPGLALFYGGLVRPKNILSTMMHSFILMGVVTIIWAIAGYSLSFAEGNWLIGDFRFLFLNGVGTAPSDYAPTIPQLTFMIYQLMFAVITPALISGAYAERMKFSGMLLFTVLWMFIVYFPMAHMVWGKGGLLNVNGGKFPCLDFAGGTVVHITSGMSALVCALVLGKRQGAFVEAMKPNSMVLSTVGACLLWVGWFGFNAGSALNASGLASSAFVATHFAAASAALSWLCIEWRRQGKPSMLGGISGCVAGLVAITPASGFVKPMPAIAIGIAAGLICYTMVSIVKSKFKYDDSLDAFGVHGIGGTVGALLTGVFAVKEVQDVFNGKPVGLLEGNGGQMLNQALGAGIAIFLGVVGSLVILRIVKATVGIRATDDDEREGLDLSMHGEEGYNFQA